MDPYEYALGDPAHNDLICLECGCKLDPDDGICGECGWSVDYGAE